MTIDPKILQARWFMNEIHSEDLPLLACDALERGFDGRALRILAGLNKPVRSDLELLAEEAFQEMGLPRRLSQREAGLILAQEVASGILAGDIDEYSGSWKIFLIRLSVEELDELVCFEEWHTKWEQCKTSACVAKCRQGIRMAAKALLGQPASTKSNPKPRT